MLIYYIIRKISRKSKPTPNNFVVDAFEDIEDEFIQAIEED